MLYHIISKQEDIMKSLNGNSPLPLYFQLQEDLKRDIEMGTYGEGEKIPTEKMLEQIYNVSRITVRKAVEGLVYEGILVKRQGIGTIVSEKKYHEKSLKLESFVEKMKEQGFQVDTQILEAARMRAPKRISQHLSIDPNEEVICVKRLRQTNGIPLGIFTAYLPVSLGVSADDDFTSLFRLLEEKYGVRISHSDRSIVASNASKEEATLLGIRPAEAVLLIKNTTYSDSGKPIEYSEGVYRSDRYEYNLRYTR